MNLAISSGRYVAMSCALGLAPALVACGGKNILVYESSDGSSGTTSLPEADAGPIPAGGDAGAPIGHDGAGGTGGTSQVSDAAAVPDVSSGGTAPDATTANRDSSVGPPQDSTIGPPEDRASTPGETDVAASAERDVGSPPDAVDPGNGPRTLFSFDADSDFNVCFLGVPIVSPCWESSVDQSEDDAGFFAPVADEAVAGHTPPRALAWTAAYPGYAVGMRLTATFGANQNWSGRSRLHISAKVTSGLSSILAYELFVQGGVGADYVPIYQVGQAEDLVPAPGMGSRFLELAVDFNAPTVNRQTLVDVAGLGIFLHPVFTPIDGEPVPPPSVIEIDNIWLE